MEWDIAVVLILLTCTIVMFALNRPRMDAVALMMMTLLPLTGVVSVTDALAGLSDPNVVLIAALFVIGEGLVRTGVAQKLGDLLVKGAGRHEARLVVLLMVVVAGIGSMMSSAGVVGIFIPLVLRISRNTGVSPGRLMMPLSVAALISGMLTLIATPPNLVVHGQIVRAGYDGFGFFEFGRFGVPILIVTMAYMVATRHWLAKREEGDETRAGYRQPRLSDWVEQYGLTGRDYRLRIVPRSPCAGQRLGELGLRSHLGLNVLAIERQKRFSPTIVEPSADTRLEAGDILYVDAKGSSEDMRDVCRQLHLEALPFSEDETADSAQTVGMAELMIPAESGLIGKTAITARFRSLYQLSIIGMKRGKRPITASVQEEPFRMGDTLLVAGPWKAIGRLRTDPGELIVLHVPADMEDVVAQPARAPFAVLSLAVVVVLMVTGVVPNVLAALIGCFLMAVTGCIGINHVYRAIQWPTLFLIVGMLPFSVALQQTGGVDWAVQSLVGFAGSAGPTFMLTIVFTVTALLGLFISNTATAVLMAPVAIGLAAELGMSPHAFGMAVVLASSAAFITPVSSPVNVLVVGPGNYKFMDFVRVGVPLFFIVMVVSIALLRIVYFP